MKPILILLPLVLFFGSCKKGEYAYNQIDLNARKNLYKLFIVQDSDDNYYYSNNKGKCDVLVTNDVLVGHNYFGDFNNVHHAVAYARKINEDDVTQSTTISIRKSDGEFEKTWRFYNPVDLKDGKLDGSFSLYDVDISVDEAYFEYSQSSESGIKIKFTETDTGNGFRMTILNFVRKKGKWSFLYKERIDTRDDAKATYCRDSTNYNGGSVQLPNFISYSDLFDFYDSRCK